MYPKLTKESMLKFSQKQSEKLEKKQQDVVGLLSTDDISGSRQTIKSILKRRQDDESASQLDDSADEYCIPVHVTSQYAVTSQIRHETNRLSNISRVSFAKDTKEKRGSTSFLNRSGLSSFLTKSKHLDSSLRRSGSTNVGLRGSAIRFVDRKASTVRRSPSLTLVTTHARLLAKPALSRPILKTNIRVASQLNVHMGEIETWMSQQQVV